MMSAFDEFAAATLAVTDIAGLKRALTHALSREGYDNHIMTSISPRSVGDVAWLEFPAGYAETYVAEGWQDVDPVLAAALVAKRPLVWADVASRRALDNRARGCLAACKELGVHSGIVFPQFGPDQRNDVLSISKRNVSDAETDKKRLPIVQAICSQAWWTYVQLSHVDAPQDDASVQLTSREREALIWVKAGKSNEQIADIMLVTDRTVQFHINNAMIKLGASNRISAVVIGLQRGLIRL